MFDRRPCVPRRMAARTREVGLTAPKEPEFGLYADQVSIPGPKEPVEWSANLRATLPEYVVLQLHEAAHRERKTLQSVLLHVLSAHRDTAGRSPFYVREEDLVADRRKLTKRERQ